MTTSKTLCWNCSKVYTNDAAACPDCSATNANNDLDKAQTEMRAQFLGMSQDAEPVARYAMSGGL